MNRCLLTFAIAQGDPAAHGSSGVSVVGAHEAELDEPVLDERGVVTGELVSRAGAAVTLCDKVSDHRFDVSLGKCRT